MAPPNWSFVCISLNSYPLLHPLVESPSDSQLSEAYILMNRIYQFRFETVIEGEIVLCNTGSYALKLALVLQPPYY